MSPVDIAGTALRIANARTPNPGYDTPSVIAFAEAMRASDGIFASELHKLIPSELTKFQGGEDQPLIDRSNCLLSQAFDLLIDVINYSAINSFGLPKAMIVELPLDLIQVLVYWIIIVGPSNIQGKFALPEIRGEMIRFILFWRLCRLDDRSNSKMGLQAFEFLTKYVGKGTFPGRELYRWLTGTHDGETASDEQTKCAIELVSPDDLKRYATVSRSEMWLEWNERFERSGSSAVASRQLYRYWWESGKRTLLLTLGDVRL